MNIIQALNDPLLFKPFLSPLGTWDSWKSALSVLHGLPVLSGAQSQLCKSCTGRTTFPTTGFQKALFLTGRRSGKSRIAAVAAAFEACLSGREKSLAPGETGIVAVISPTKAQSKIVHSYVRAIFSTSLLKPEVVSETTSGFELRNGVQIQILTGDHRSIRGFTLLAAIVDESAFFATSEESKVKSDTELVRALLPGLATTGGRLIAITSPYAKKGWTYRTYAKQWGNERGSTLCWNAASRTMNPTLAQAVVDEAMADDREAAKSEYLGLFREDVCEFVPRSLVESLVQKGVQELLPRSAESYVAFVDVSGGRADDAAVAIAHRNAGKVILDCVRRYRPPFNPQEVIRLIAEELKRFSIRRVTGDNYSAEFVASAFRVNGIAYVKCDKPKSELYLEFLPRLCSAQVELLDNEKLVDQIAGLERKTRSGGRDIIDHPQGGRDDMANASAGVCDVLAAPVRAAGAFFDRPPTASRFARTAQMIGVLR